MDEVIDTIRRSRTAETAHDNLRKHFKLSNEQAQAILQMQLRRLAGLERKKIEDEYKEKVDLIKMLSALLASPKMMRVEVARELKTIREKYADPRRTVVVSSAAGDVREMDFLGPNENTTVSVTESGLISRTFGEGAPRITEEQSDPPLAVLGSNTTHTLYLLTAEGQAATIPTNVLPQAENMEQGVAYRTLCPLTSEEQVTAVLSLSPGLEEGYLAAITALGEVKRLRLEDLPGMSAHPFKFMDIEPGDRLIWVGYVSDVDEVILATFQGQAIRFPVGDVRPTGLGAGGMRAIKLTGEQDRVVGAGIADDQGRRLGVYGYRRRQDHARCRIPGSGTRRARGDHHEAAQRRRRTGGGDGWASRGSDRGGYRSGQIRVDDHR